MTSPPSPGPALGRNYVKLFGASVVSNLGDGIGLIAYPWLASAVTRDPVLIALVVVAQRLPWLLFSLPVGVITDRYDRRRLMVAANVGRAVITLIVALAVLGAQSGLPGPDMIDEASVGPTDTGLYLLILMATVLLGLGEVLYDNSAQTIMPSIVDDDGLEKANGRLWGAEQVANAFVGPPLGAFLLAVTFALPFIVDAATFAIGAVLILSIPRPQSVVTTTAAKQSWRAELREGFGWLWQHELLRSMAIVLGLLNGLFTMMGAILVLYAQEILAVSPAEFALLETGGAIGAVAGGWSAAAISARIGSGPSLWLTLIISGLTTLVIGATSSWPVVWLMFAVSMFFAVLWNVITVSLRQSIIPDELLGRVNSVYRFFAWGMMPIGALLGGVIVAAVELVGPRSLALRAPILAAGVLHLVLFAFAAPRLTTSKLEAACTAASDDDA